MATSSRFTMIRTMKGTTYDEDRDTFVMQRREFAMIERDATRGC